VLVGKSPGNPAFELLIEVFRDDDRNRQQASTESPRQLRAPILESEFGRMTIAETKSAVSPECKGRVAKTNPM